tara:strand:- start:436 stop:1170 length:735 start_codon:yes stop_codon:yes gene_type:complete
MIKYTNIRGYKMHYYENDNVIGRGFKNGRWWDLTKLQTIKKYRIKGKDLLDIGAFIGSTSILMSEILKEEDAIVHSFEPTYFECLEKNINQNNLSDKIKIYNVGLSNIEGYVFPPRDNFTDEGNYGGLALVNNHLSPTKDVLIDKNEKNIEIKKLDSYNLKNIGFLKIDVEGMELEFLKGAKSTLIENNFPPILIEIWGEVCWRTKHPEYFKNNRISIFKFLEDLGYKSTIPFKREGDYVFIKK